MMLMLVFPGKEDFRLSDLDIEDLNLNYPNLMSTSLKTTTVWLEKSFTNKDRKINSSKSPILNPHL